MDTHLKKILLAEDDDGIRQVIKIILEQMGISAVGVSSKASLMQTVKERPFDLILLDVSIIGGNGAEIAKELKKDPFLADTPIFLLSANTFVDRLAKESGADGFIEKPFSLEYFENTIRDFIK